MPPKLIYEKPTEQELAALPQAGYSGKIVTVKRLWSYDHAQKQLSHGVKDLEVRIGPLVANGKRTYWYEGRGDHSHIITQIFSKHLGVAVDVAREEHSRGGTNESSGARESC
jgi:hypothetical protein